MLFLGRISYNKNFQDFLALVKNNTSKTFVYAGPTLISTCINEEIPHNLIVKYSPSQFELDQMLQNTKYIFASSTYEAFSQTPLEAHLMGCLAPILTSPYYTREYPALPDWPRVSLESIAEYLKTSLDLPSYIFIRSLQHNQITLLSRYIRSFQYFGMPIDV